MAKAKTKKGKKIVVQDCTPKTKPEANDIHALFAAMSDEEKAEFIKANTPKPVSKRRAQEEQAAEYLFNNMPKLKKLMDSPHIPGGFVLEIGKDREGNFFSNTRTIRRKRK